MAVGSDQCGGSVHVGFVSQCADFEGADALVG
jgi:hypothetical protein